MSSKKVTPIRPSSPAIDYSVLDNINSVTVNDTITEKCVMYICYLKEPSKILIDKRALSAIQYLQTISESNAVLQKIEKCMSKHDTIYTIFTAIFKYYHSELKNLIINEKFMNDPTSNVNEGVTSLFFTRNGFFYYLSKFCCHATNCSKEFTIKWHSFKGTEVVLEYLNDDQLMQSIPKLTNSNKIPGIVMILTFVIATMLNFSTLAGYNRKEFQDLKTVEIVKKCLSISGLDDLLVTYLYIIMTNVVNEDEINSLPDIKRAIENIESYVSICGDYFETGKGLKRTIIDFEDETGKFHSMPICSTSSGLHLYELLTCILHLAVNDKIKLEIYEDYHFKKYLEVFIMKGNDFEKYIAAKLLWQLCFANEIASSIYSNIPMYDHIKSLTKSNCELKELRKCCDGILWSIEKIEGIEKRKDKNEDLLAGMHQMRFRRKIPANHIMISYNSESRDLCLKIKQELEKQNHKVWIDVENIHGSSLEAMANAVEDSKCVLICATEKYKQSPNCRAEAEYTFKLNKPFIPLIMQQHYSPDGWLGMIIGSKIYINFTKYHFSEALDRLFKEVNSATGHQIDDAFPISTVTPIHNKPIEQSSVIEKWSNDDVKKWLKDSKIDPQIAEVLKKFSGNQLKRLRSIRREAPDYFYQSISQNNKIDLLSVLNFTEEFEKLT